MRLPLVLFSLTLAGCTFGAPPAQTTSATTGGLVTTVDVNLTLDPSGPLAAGTAGAFRPLATEVSVGTFLRFVNTDGFSHTVTSLAGTAFPDATPFDATALTPHGDRLSTGFSAGILTAGASSSPILADVPGTYLYGCFFHYGAPMRAAIVVR